MKIKERRQAAQDGDKQYYNGRPCNRGHNSPRYTTSGVCIDCNKLAATAYRKEISDALDEAKGGDDAAG